MPTCWTAFISILYFSKLLNKISFAVVDAYDKVTFHENALWIHILFEAYIHDNDLSLSN